MTNKQIIKACDAFKHNERTYIVTLTTNSYLTCKNCANEIRKN